MKVVVRVRKFLPRGMSYVVRICLSALLIMRELEQRINQRRLLVFG